MRFKFRLEASENAQLGDFLREILSHARRELGRAPRYIRFRYAGKDGETRHHEMNFN